MPLETILSVGFLIRFLKTLIFPTKPPPRRFNQRRVGFRLLSPHQLTRGVNNVLWKTGQPQFSSGTRNFYRITSDSNNGLAEHQPFIELDQTGIVQADPPSQVAHDSS